MAELGVTSTNWLQYIFYDSKRQPVHPLEHILVQVFLDHMPVTTAAHPYGAGPWKCPNSYASHDDEFPIKKIAIRTAEDSTVNASVHCSCGFRFTFIKTAEGDQRKPVIKRVWAYGPSWKAEAERLRRAGMDETEIAIKMSISLSSVKCLLNAKTRQTSCTDKKIMKARAKWLKLLDQAPRRSVTTARRRNYGIYQFLRKYDREWMLAQTEPRKEKLDWEERDAAWSGMLVDAARRIKAMVPPRRAAKTVLVKNAGLNLRMLNGLHRLPLCHKALSVHAESSKEFQIRLKGQQHERLQGITEKHAAFQCTETPP